ncbi:DUF3089 domain-containing protein [Pseudodesulfovibrio sp. JC047]|uniref:DUF3089 domain-containing protein n=1 Tax=Pseudodesulfovibrio sp. JC047 TaxID=2683199 RepID=UPI0013D1828E|nr:DUF3089 domain-containing protein [Pseudodesulfovibrio sp. JC047]NDV20328.1 DUF3089 domain-containing protein [Pseudodesulfovibrio sp. JC047]
MIRCLASGVFASFVLTLLTTFAVAGTSLPPFDATDVPHAPDYADRACWLVQPSAPDAHPVDVFWVYPTVLHDDVHWLMPVDNDELRTAATTSLTTQASVFSGQANVYAPLYRQMNMAALSLPHAETETLIQFGKDDIRQAFTYYLEHLNNGRPFILAGHSQGSEILTELMVASWGKFGCENRLVAAYLIGWSVTPDDLAANPALALCKNATQTRCIVTYNTVAPGRQTVAPTIRPGAQVTNPLSWATNDIFVPAKQNLGAVFFAADGTPTTVPHFTSAQILESGLVVQPLDPELVNSDLVSFPKGVYHFYDYSLFYENLKQNVHDRIQTFSRQ